MITRIFEWIVVGAANRIEVASPELVDQGGVTADEAFKLLATEWGRHVRHFARTIVHSWNQPTGPIGATGATGPTGFIGMTSSQVAGPMGQIGATGPIGRRP